MDFTTVRNGAITLNVAVQGEGPLIVCVHGWPELWYSWRHQIAHFAARGYKVAALDVRGYGASSKPPEIEAYSLRNLAADVAAVIDQLGGGQADLFGHDWGATVVWTTALLHPDKVRAVAGLSVPYRPRGATSPLATMRKIYAGKFFYQIYFQQEGVVEAELERDVPAALRKIYFAISGDAPLNAFLADKAADAPLLEGMVDPQPFPAWMSDADLKVYTNAYAAGGFGTSVNRYRAQEIDFADLADYAGKPITQPAFFIAGERDAIRSFIPGTDLYAHPGAFCTDFRGSVIVPGMGHWMEEAPAAVNAALEAFLAGRP